MIRNISTSVARLFVLTCAIVLMAGTAQAQDPRASEAQAAARAWLALVDRGDLVGSWKAGGKKFQEAMAADAWADAMRDAREPLGPVKSRAVTATRFQQNLPGGPDGEYSLITYESGFEKRGAGRESVTLERESDGVWRVIGYFIR
jgi:hypothetical protein